MIVSNIASLVLPLHGALLYPISVKITDPFAISVALGIYVGVSDVKFMNVPVPDVVHNRDE